MMKPPTLMYTAKPTGGKLILGGMPTDEEFITNYILKNNGITPGFQNIPLYAINLLLEGIEQTGQEADPSSIYKEMGISELRLNNPDHIEPSLYYIQAGVEYIEDHLSKGEHVYVHCKAGHGRSAAIVYAFLVKTFRGTSLFQIQQYMSNLRDVRHNMFLQQNIRAFIRTINRQDYAQEMSRTEAAARQALLATQQKERKKYGIVLTYPPRRLPPPPQQLRQQLGNQVARNGFNGFQPRARRNAMAPQPQQLQQQLGNHNGNGQFAQNGFNGIQTRARRNAFVG